MRIGAALRAELSALTRRPRVQADTLIALRSVCERAIAEVERLETLQATTDVNDGTTPQA